jgi:hypothetical protein
LTFAEAVHLFTKAASHMSYLTLKSCQNTPP